MGRNWSWGAAWDLQERALQYLKERQPPGYELDAKESARVDREVEEILRDLDRAYRAEDPDAHERVIARLVKGTLEDYASHMRGFQKNG